MASTTLGNSAFNGMFRDGTIPKCERIIVEGEPAVLVCILGDPAYPLLPFLMKEFSKGERNLANVFLVNVYPQQEWLSSAHLGN